MCNEQSLPPGPPPELPESLESYDPQNGLAVAPPKFLPEPVPNSLLELDPRRNIVTPLGQNGIAVGSKDTIFFDPNTGQQTRFEYGDTKLNLIHPESSVRRAGQAIVQRVKNTLGGMWRTVEAHRSESKNVQHQSPSAEADGPENEPEVSYDLLLERRMWDAILASYDQAEKNAHMSFPNESDDEIDVRVLRALYEELNKYVLPQLEALVNYPNRSVRDVRPPSGRYSSPSLIELVTPMQNEGLVVFDESGIHLDSQQSAHAQKILRELGQRILDAADEFYKKLNSPTDPSP